MRVDQQRNTPPVEGESLFSCKRRQLTDPLCENLPQSQVAHTCKEIEMANMADVNQLKGDSDESSSQILRSGVRPSEREIIEIIDTFDIYVGKATKEMIEEKACVNVGRLQVKFNLLMISMAFIVGMYAAMANIFSKLFVLSLDQMDDFIEAGGSKGTVYFQTSLSMALILISLALNLVTLNQALALFSQLKVIPAYQSWQMICTTLAGGIILNEFKAYNLS
mmetsp:Transcript_17185/g.28954  ORF Transcript_17185/g.28954 Transcript_17185/m.28954 type:complete len:222 (-) Transcript_17185:195-860(-)